MGGHPSEMPSRREVIVNADLNTLASQLQVFAAYDPHGPTHANELLAIALRIEALAAYGTCHYCKKVVPLDCSCCASCADERGP